MAILNKKRPKELHTVSGITIRPWPEPKRAFKCHSMLRGICLYIYCTAVEWLESMPFHVRKGSGVAHDPPPPPRRSKIIQGPARGGWSNGEFRRSPVLLPASNIADSCCLLLNHTYSHMEACLAGLSLHLVDRSPLVVWFRPVK